MGSSLTGLRSFDGAILRRGEVRTVATTALSGPSALPAGFGAALIQEASNEYDVPPLEDHVMFIVQATRPRVGIRVADGQRRMGELLCGRVTVVPAGTDSWWDCIDSGPNLHMHFAPEALGQWFGDERYVRSLCPAVNRDDPMVRRLGRTLAFELQTGQLGGRMVIEGLALQIGAHMLRTYGIGKLPMLAKGGLAPRQLRQVLELMADHLDQPLSVETLAQAARLSHFHFVRAFKTSTGLPPHRYLIQLRIEQAQLLLETTRLPMADIAARVGYEAPQSFARLFRRETGCTPSAYRAVRQA